MAPHAWVLCRACFLLASVTMSLMTPCQCWVPSSLVISARNFPHKAAAAHLDCSRSFSPVSLPRASALDAFSQTRVSLCMMSSSSNNAGVGMDTNHAKKSEAIKLAREDKLAPCIILVRPFLDQNIGTTARAMLNFGLWDLRLVDPQCNHLSEDTFARASGAEGVLSSATVFDTVEAAVEDLHRVYATTARIRAFVTKVVSAEGAAADAVAIAANDGEQSGFLFGPERSGLTNTDLRLVDRLVQIPTLSMFSSLNLAQAVNVMAYESWKAREAARARGEEGSSEEEGAEVLTQLEVKGGRATKREIDAFLVRLEAALESRDFQPQEEKRETVFRQLRSIYSRADLTSAESQLLQGVLTNLLKP